MTTMNKPAILCLEDEPTSRNELAEFLANENYAVIPADSATEAVKLARTKDIGLLLVDIRMPEPPDGIDAAREIQQMQPDAPVIFVTAYSDDHQYRQRVLEAELKVSGWIDKPLLVDERRQLLFIVKREMDLHLMRDIVMALTACGLSPVDALAAVRAIMRHQGLSEEALRNLEKQLAPPDSPERVISDLSLALGRVREHFDVIEDQQFAFDYLKEIALSRLYSVYKHFDQDTRRMALLIRMAVRQMKGLTLTSEQLDALEHALAKLANSNEVGLSSRRDCRRRFRRVGIETMITLGPKARELIEIYDESDESEGDL